MVLTYQSEINEVSYINFCIQRQNYCFQVLIWYIISHYNYN